MVIYDLCQRSHRGFLDPLNSILRSILVYDTTRMRSGRFLRKSKLLTQIEGYLGVFGPAEFDFEIYLSVRCNAHAQERIITHFKAFHANWRVPRGFFESQSSFPRSI